MKDENLHLTRKISIQRRCPAGARRDWEKARIWGVLCQMVIPSSSSMSAFTQDERDEIKGMFISTVDLLDLRNPDGTVIYESYADEDYPSTLEFHTLKVTRVQKDTKNGHLKTGFDPDEDGYSMILGVNPDWWREATAEERAVFLVHEATHIDESGHDSTFWYTYGKHTKRAADNMSGMEDIIEEEIDESEYWSSVRSDIMINAWTDADRKEAQQEQALANYQNGKNAEL